MRRTKEEGELTFRSRLDYKGVPNEGSADKRTVGFGGQMGGTQGILLQIGWDDLE